MDNSEDELDKDNDFLDDHHEDDETSEALIMAFITHNYQSLEEEIHHVAQIQCL